MKWIFGLLLLGGAASARCLPATVGPADPQLRRVRVASYLGAIRAHRALRLSHQRARLDWEMQADATPGSVLSLGADRMASSIEVAQCPPSGIVFFDEGPPDFNADLERSGLSARFGDPSTPIQLSLTRFVQTDRLRGEVMRLTDPADPESFATSTHRQAHDLTVWIGEARLIDLATLTLAQVDDLDRGPGWYGRVALPRFAASVAGFVRDGSLEFIDAGLDQWRPARSAAALDARLGWLRDEAVTIATLGVERPIFGGYVVPRLAAQGEFGDAVRVRTARASVAGVLDTTVRLGGCPWLCFLAVGIEAEGGWQVSDAAFIEGITGTRWARGPWLDGALVLGVRPISLRVGGFMATNRFDTLTRLPDAVDAAERGLRADLRIGL